MAVRVPLVTMYTLRIHGARRSSERSEKRSSSLSRNRLLDVMSFSRASKSLLHRRRRLRGQCIRYDMHSSSWLAYCRRVDTSSVTTTASSQTKRAVRASGAVSQTGVLGPLRPCLTRMTREIHSVVKSSLDLRCRPCNPEGGVYRHTWRCRWTRWS